MNNTEKKLERKRYSVIAGVCSGLADYLGMGTGLLQIIFVILFFTPFPIFWTYIILWVFMSKEPKY